MKTAVRILAALMLAALAACHGAEPEHRFDTDTDEDTGQTVTPGDTEPDDPSADPGTRPGLADPTADDILRAALADAAFLNDPTVRYEAPSGDALRRTTPGVMAMRRAASSEFALVDIDGNRRVTFVMPGFSAADSTALAGTTLTVNGADVPIAICRLSRSRGSLIWCGLLTSDGALHRLVIDTATP